MTTEPIVTRVYIPGSTPRYRVRRVDRERWIVSAAGGGEEWMTTEQIRATLERSRYDEIAMREVASSQIVAIGYDPATWDLLVHFHGDPESLYRYYDVEPIVVAPLLLPRAPADKFSVGSYFAEHIKADDERYPYARLA